MPGSDQRPRTARREIGGVERLAHEMARRLPALRPGRYRVCRPPAALAHRAGHLWEQLLLADRAGARLIYCPANLAPLASRRNVVRDPRRGPAAASPSGTARCTPLPARVLPAARAPGARA